MMGYSIAGRRPSCSSVRRCPSTSRPTRPSGCKRVTGADASDLVSPRSGDIVTVGRDPHRADPHARATPRAASASWSTTASSPATRCSSRAAAAPTCPAATPRRCTRASPRSWPRCPTTPRCSPGTSTRRSPPRRWARPAPTTSCSGPRTSSSSSRCSAEAFWDLQRQRQRRLLKAGTGPRVRTLAGPATERGQTSGGAGAADTAATPDHPKSAHRVRCERTNGAKFGEGRWPRRSQRIHSAVSGSTALSSDRRASIKLAARSVAGRSPVLRAVAVCSDGASV